MKVIDGERLEEMIRKMMDEAWGTVKDRRIRDAMELVLRMIRDLPDIRGRF